jgi:hypothetical protein
MKGLRNVVVFMCAVALVVTGCDSGSSGGSGDSTNDEEAPLIGGGAQVDPSEDGSSTPGEGNGTDPSNPGTPPDTPPSTTPDPPSYPPGCSFQGFDATSTMAVVDMSLGETWVYQGLAFEPSVEPNALLSVELRQYAPHNGPNVPGVYDLAGSTYQQGGALVLVATGCKFASGGGCDNIYIADEGQLVLTAAAPGGRLTGYLEDAVLHEVEIDQNGNSSVVAGGGMWCLDGYQFDEPMEEAPEIPAAEGPAESTCVAGGTGTYIGHNVKNLTLQNCNGEMVELHGACGGPAKAMWIMATAGWCSACSETLNQLAAQHGGSLSRAQIAQATPGMDMLIVLGENAQGGLPTTSYCEQYAAGHNVDPAMVVIDHSVTDVDVPLVDPPGYALPVNGLAETWSAINPYLKAEGNSVSTAYPWMAVLRAPNMEYVWSDYSGMGSLDSSLNMLLNE